MGRIIYTLITRFYFFAISFSSFFNEKAKQFKEGRKGIFQRLKQDLSKKKGRYVWFHCASLGEFEQGRPLIEAFKLTFPDYKILITFFSPSGYEIRKNYANADLIYYLPEDSASNAKKFLDLVRPELAVFIKYEYWYNFITEIYRRKIPLLSVSSIFRKEQPFFKYYGSFYRRMLKKFNHFFVQDEASLKLLHSINIHAVTVSGDTRFDRVKDIAKKVRSLPEIEMFIGNAKVFIAGSAWEEDLNTFAPLAGEFPEMKFIIAPHEIHEKMIQKVINFFPGYCRYTSGPDPSQQVLIIDNIGLLSSLYQYGDYAFVGGGFGKGLHNILEAATFGMPVFFGNKNYQKFVEAVNLKKKGGAYPVSDYQELRKFFLHLEENPDALELAGKTCEKFVADNTGATSLIMDYCSKVLKAKSWKEE